MKMTSSFALMIEAVSTSETSVNFYQTTRRNTPEDSHLYILFDTFFYPGLDSEN
jgi:hypothetical protein